MSIQRFTADKSEVATQVRAANLGDTWITYGEIADVVEVAVIDYPLESVLGSLAEAGEIHRRTETISGDEILGRETIRVTLYRFDE